MIGKCRMNGCAALDRVRAANWLIRKAEAAETSREISDLLIALEFYAEESVDQFYSGGFVDADSVACAELALSDGEVSTWETIIAEEILRRARKQAR
jgi:hypothetical protein